MNYKNCVLGYSLYQLLGFSEVVCMFGWIDDVHTSRLQKLLWSTYSYLQVLAKGSIGQEGKITFFFATFMFHFLSIMYFSKRIIVSKMLEMNRVFWNQSFKIILTNIWRKWAHKSNETIPHSHCLTVSQTFI